jgi:hypothetical protein
MDTLASRATPGSASRDDSLNQGAPQCRDCCYPTSAVRSSARRSGPVRILLDRNPRGLRTSSRVFSSAAANSLRTREIGQLVEGFTGVALPKVGIDLVLEGPKSDPIIDEGPFNVSLSGFSNATTRLTMFHPPFEVLRPIVLQSRLVDIRTRASLRARPLRGLRLAAADRDHMGARSVLPNFQ